MERQKTMSRHAWQVAITFLLLHFLCIALLPQFTNRIGYIFLFVSVTLATGATFIRSQMDSKQNRALWLLFGTALFIWAVGVLASAREELVLRTDGLSASTSDLFYFFYGVPILLAISTPTERVHGRFILTLEGIPVAISAFLSYILIFSVIPFSGSVAHPIPASLLALAFNFENLLLATIATIRLFSLPKKMSRSDRLFYKSLCHFLWTYAITVGIYNAAFIANPTGTRLLEALPDVPFLVLTVYALVPARIEQLRTVGAHRRKIGLFIDTASPLFFPLSIVAVGVAIAHNHFDIAVAAITSAIIVYGVRSTLIQLRYRAVQTDLQNARDHIEAISLTDELTGVANRRLFDRTLRSEWTRVARQQHPLSLLLIDIDYFKCLNDAFGHMEGDLSLRQVARALKASLRREADVLARYGGEEFASILPATDASGARAVAARMQNVVHGLKLRNKCPLGEIVTISIGICTYVFPEAGSPEILLATADKALYSAKAGGRDRIESLLCFTPAADKVQL